MLGKAGLAWRDWHERQREVKKPEVIVCKVKDP